MNRQTVCFTLIVLCLTYMVSLLDSRVSAYREGVKDGANTTVVEIECKPEQPANAASGSQVKWVF